MTEKYTHESLWKLMEENEKVVAAMPVWKRGKPFNSRSIRDIRDYLEQLGMMSMGPLELTFDETRVTLSKDDNS